MKRALGRLLYDDHTIGDGVYPYLPLTADVQRDPAGAPVVALTRVGDRGFLSFCGLWQTGADDLEALATEIGARAAARSPVRLAFVPVEAASCAAMLGDGTGAFTPLATTDTSGYPPYPALFNLDLDGEPLAAAQRALAGEAGWFGFEYRAALPRPVRVRARLEAEGARLGDWLAAQIGGDGITGDTLAAAAADDAARLTIDPPGIADTAARAALADMLAARPAPAKDEMLALDLAVETRAHDPVRVFADLGALMAPALT